MIITDLHQGFLWPHSAALTRHPFVLATTRVTSCFSAPTAISLSLGSNSKLRNFCNIRTTTNPASSNANSSASSQYYIVTCRSWKEGLRPRQTLGPPLKGRYPQPMFLRSAALSTLGSHRSGRKESASSPYSFFIRCIT
jgi:hypothetical protein